MVMKKSEFFADLAEILSVPINELNSDSQLQELGWDSLSSLAFIGYVDEKFGLALQPKRIAECATAEELAALFPEGTLT
jgi:acyl carrier protein